MSRRTRSDQEFLPPTHTRQISAAPERIHFVAPCPVREPSLRSPRRRSGQSRNSRPRHSRERIPTASSLSWTPPQKVQSRHLRIFDRRWCFERNGRRGLSRFSLLSSHGIDEDFQRVPPAISFPRGSRSWRRLMGRRREGRNEDEGSELGVRVRQRLICRPRPLGFVERPH